MFNFQTIRRIALMSMGMAVLGQAPTDRLNQHRVSNPRSPAPEPGAEKVPLARLASTRAEWESVRRPALIKDWTAILGKLEPTADDLRWFTDVTKARVIDTEETPK